MNRFDVLCEASAVIRGGTADDLRMALLRAAPGVFGPMSEEAPLPPAELAALRAAFAEPKARSALLKWLVDGWRLANGFMDPPIPGHLRN